MAVAVSTLVIVALVAWLPLPSLMIPSSRLVSWKMNYGFLGPGFDPATAQTTTVVPVEVSISTCAPSGMSWLAPPTVTYTPWSVTITLHTTDAYGDVNKCIKPDKSGRLIVGTLLSGRYLAVQLSEPLGGRQLFDGVTFPPQARPYPGI